MRLYSIPGTVSALQLYLFAIHERGCARGAPGLLVRVWAAWRETLGLLQAKMSKQHTSKQASTQILQLIYHNQIQVRSSAEALRSVH